MKAVIEKEKNKNEERERGMRKKREEKNERVVERQKVLVKKKIIITEMFVEVGEWGGGTIKYNTIQNNTIQ